jgi:hypothetical protein
MGYADLEAFRPSESAYSQPGEYEATQRNVALEKASYLSSMDQYYADLEERQREFDLTLSFEKEKWGDQMGLAWQQQEFEEGAWAQEFAESQEQFDVMAALQEEELELQEEYLELYAEQQAHGQQQDWIGNIFGAVGAADVVGGWFDW